MTGRIFYIPLFILFCILSADSSAQMYSVRDSVTSDGRNCKIFTLAKNQKGKTAAAVSYVFVEKRSDISLGCDLYKTENAVKTPMSFFSVAAYTKDESGRMNYNSILPYISIIQAGQRTVLSIDCPLIVLNPDRADEKIIESKNLYGLINTQEVELKSH
ncbi:MAG: hypothetical protein IJ250_06315 [Bacteroidales bacterium]|nr:hypothetical protein [Bacteroidales bacterium]